MCIYFDDIYGLRTVHYFVDRVRSGNTSVGEQVSFDDSDMQHAKVIVRLEAKDRKG